MRLKPLTFLLLFAFALLRPASVRAQPVEENANTYVVARGDTLSTIAQRLGCSERDLAERNHLAEPFALRHNQRLRLPRGVTLAAGPRPQVSTRPLVSAPHSPPTPARPVPPPRPAPPPARPTARNADASRWGRNRHPGTVVLVRHQSGEATTLNLRRPSTRTLARMRNFLRYPTGASHTIDARLLRQLAVVSDHFGGRTLRVISGFRPFRRGQYTPHSNHNIGHAIDFRVDGVPNRTLRDFCRTLPNTGCGFYPRSVFVHMDTRSESAYWVDWSRPGQRPIYGSEGRPPPEHPRTPAANANTPPPAANPQADEEMDDVATETPAIRTDPTDPDDDSNTPPPSPPSPSPTP